VCHCCCHCVIVSQLYFSSSLDGAERSHWSSLDLFTWERSTAGHASLQYSVFYSIHLWFVNCLFIHFLKIDTRISLTGRDHLLTSGALHRIGSESWSAPLLDTHLEWFAGITGLVTESEVVALNVIVCQILSSGPYCPLVMCFLKEYFLNVCF